MTAPVAFVAATVAWALAGTLERRSTRRLVHARLRSAPAAVRRHRPPPLVVIGRAVLRPAGRGASDIAARRAGAGVVATVLALVHPLFGAVAAAGFATDDVLRRRRQAAGAGSAALRSLPDAVELLGVAARAGLPAAAAIDAVAERAPPPWDEALAAVRTRAARGERLVEALDALVDVAGEPARPLRAVLRSSVDDGASLPPSLDRLAVDARDVRRRQAEEAARRIPVRLLLPLVACSLPAFALLSIVPILAGALGSLEL